MKKSPCSVRHAQPPADTAAIEDVMFQAASAAYGKIFPGATREDYRKGSASWLTSPPPPTAYTLVCEDDGRIVGTISAFQVGPGRARIEGFYVLPTYQGHHVGRALWDGIIQLLQGEGYTDVDLFVLADNASSRGVYEALGCRVDPHSTGVMTVGSIMASGVRYRVTIPSKRQGAG